MQILHCSRTSLIMPDPRTSYRKLKILHQRQVKHRSHYKFITSCLKNNKIPKGLKINTQSQVPETSQKQELLKKWNEVLQGTSRELLTLLKNYYCRMDSFFNEKRAVFRTQLHNRKDFNNNIQRIDTLFSKYQKNTKTKKKQETSSFWGQNQNKKCCCRKNMAN